MNLLLLHGKYKVKFVCSSCGHDFNQKWASLFIYNNNFLKVLILHLLNEDVGNRSVSVYTDSIKLFNTYYYKIPVWNADVGVSNQTEGRLNNYLLIAFLKTSLKLFYIYYLSLLLILHDLLKNFLFLKINDKILEKSCFKTQKLMKSVNIFYLLKREMTANHHKQAQMIPNYQQTTTKQQQTTTNHQQTTTNHQ